MKEIYALGIGHSTPVFIELAEACGYRIIGLYHYNESRTGEIDSGFPVLGSFPDLYNINLKGMSFLLTMGDMRIKREVSGKILGLGGNIPTLIHPTAEISRFAKISDNGVLICSHCEVHANSSIDEGCVLWHRATLEHDSRLGNYVFVGPNAYVGAYTEVEDEAFIGQCSVLISDKAKFVGKNALIGAGSLVTKPVLGDTTVFGHPAKVMVKE